MNLLKKTDKPIFISLVLILIFGLLMVFSATYKQDISFFFKQIVWVAISIFIFFLIQFVPMKVFYISSYLLYFLSMLLLVFLKLEQIG